MTDRLFALRVFAQVARTGSFSKAARELALSQPSVSRIVAGLEADVGIALMTRTTRGLRLTDAGSDYLARVEPILDALEEADHAARGTGELRGVLRVAVSSGFAAREVIPRLPGFMHRAHARADARRLQPSLPSTKTVSSYAPTSAPPWPGNARSSRSVVPLPGAQSPNRGDPAPRW